MSQIYKPDLQLGFHQICLYQSACASAGVVTSCNNGGVDDGDDGGDGDSHGVGNGDSCT